MSGGSGEVLELRTADSGVQEKMYMRKIIRVLGTNFQGDEVL